MKVLFIGNSHTFVHYVPARFVQFCRDHGVPAEAVMLTHPGVGLDWHRKQSQTCYNLMCGGYDAAVLQHNAHPFPGRESLLSAGEAMAAITPRETKIYLYMTWTEKNNPQGQEAMSEAYEALADRIGAALCPVGRLWWPLVQAHPEEEFYFADGEHTSVLGASLAAAVIGRTVLGMALDEAACFADAKRLERFPQDPRMVDLVLKDGHMALEAQHPRAKEI